MCWISTYTGKRFDYSNPQPDQICIEDIAHALSNICRWTGHTRCFYSVAEHSLHVARLCKPEYKLIGLLHDATEAYANDLNRPLKKTSGLAGYRLTEQLIWNQIVQKFNLATVKMPFDVKCADEILMNTEARDLLHETSWINPELCMAEHINPMSPLQAEAAFLLQFQLLTGQKVFDSYIESIPEQTITQDTLLSAAFSNNPRELIESIVVAAGSDQSGSSIGVQLLSGSSPLSPEELNMAEDRLTAAAHI